MATQSPSTAADATAAAAFSDRGHYSIKLEGQTDSAHLFFFSFKKKE
jgi:hypothetical protein